MAKVLKYSVIPLLLLLAVNAEKASLIFTVTDGGINEINGDIVRVIEKRLVSKHLPTMETKSDDGSIDVQMQEPLVKKFNVER